MSPDVIWVATLNEDYQPPPRVSFHDTETGKYLLSYWFVSKW